MTCSIRRIWTEEAAIKEIRRCSGNQFDPNLVEQFIKILEKNRNKEYGG